MSAKHPFFTVIYGPTAVGKTAFSLELARALVAQQQIGTEVVNGDMGQLYTPLSIGTAKPDWRNQPVEHHLFDVVHEPVAYSAHAYRSACLASMDHIAARGKMPIVVGGSGFYVRSLFYRFHEPQPVSHACDGPIVPIEPSWEQLEKIDPERARALHPHDHYRIIRALELWHRTGILPSVLKPTFELPAPCLMIFLDRETDELMDIMTRRIHVMLKEGFLDEVRALAPEWRAFVCEKGLIGYPEACALLEGSIKTEREFVETVVKNTYAYSRRQRIFWRSLKRAVGVDSRVMIHEINLTFTDHALYIKQLLEIGW